MIIRTPQNIPIRRINTPLNRPAMGGAPAGSNPHILRRIQRATNSPASEAEAAQIAADPVLSAAFKDQMTSTPAQSRNQMSRRAKPAAKPAKPAAAAAPQARVTRDVSGLAVSSLATIYGCCGLFDLCSDRDLMSFSFQGSEPFLDWIGWERTDVCRIKKSFISYTRPAYSGQTPSVGYVSNPCDDPNGVDYGVCDFTLEDFGRLRRQGPTREITKTGLRLCETAPRYRLDGTPITNDREYDMRVATEVLLQDLKRMIVDGNATTAGQFDGLERTIKTGYTSADGTNCQAMNSIVINAGGLSLTNTAGWTWNGTALASGFNFIDVLLNVYRNIQQRIRMSPVLASQQQQVGDMVLVMPSSFIDCILNAFTCWRVCNGTQYNEAVLNTLEGRNFRDSLSGGMFGAGHLTLHGFEIPILPYDYGLIKSPTRFDAYLLTGSIGNVKLLQGQYNDMNYAATQRPDRYAVTDGGRVLTYSQDDHTCEKRIVEMEPRFLNWAPWAQARFQNLRCTPVGPVISADPTETSYYPLQSFDSATCP